MTGFECWAKTTHHAAFMPNTIAQSYTVNSEKNVQDRRKTASLPSSCQQDTQKKTALQWLVRPNYGLYTRRGSAIRWLVLALPYQHAIAQVTSSAQNPMDAVGQGLTTDPNLLALSALSGPNVDGLSAPHLVTENYNQHIALPQVVIDYRDIATDIWFSQLNMLIYCFLAALMLIGFYRIRQRQLSASFAGLAIIFAFGFALLFVRVKLAA
jgi:hypothetical protein